MDKLEDLNTSSLLWYNRVAKATGSSPDLERSVGSFVGVRDALANVLALENEAAGGERILVPTGESTHRRGPRESIVNTIPPSPVYLARFE